MNKRSTFLAVALVLAAPAAQAGPYVLGGIAWHDRTFDGPEIGLEEPLGIIEAGYIWRYNARIEIAAFYEHVSSIPQKEIGYGLNMVGASVRYEWGR